MLVLPCTICRGFTAETVIAGVPLCPFHAGVEAAARLLTAPPLGPAPPPHPDAGTGEDTPADVTDFAALFAPSH